MDVSRAHEAPMLLCTRQKQTFTKDKQMKSLFSLCLIALNFSALASPTPEKTKFSFEIGQIFTSAEMGSFNNYLLPKKPVSAPTCIKQLKSVDINDGKLVTSYDAYTPPYLAYDNSQNSKTCNVIGWAKAENSSTYTLSHNWVTVEYYLPEKREVARAEFAEFDPGFNQLTLGLANVLRDSAQRISDNMNSSINRRLAEKHANRAAIFKSVAQEMMLMMCRVQAIKLADEACPGSKIDAQKYVSLLQQQYEEFIRK